VPHHQTRRVVELKSTTLAIRRRNCAAPTALPSDSSTGTKDRRRNALMKVARP
jgi:hypothetical protein